MTPTGTIASRTQALLDSGLDSILGGILRPLIVLSPEGRILGMSPAARRLGGYQQGKEIGQMLGESGWFGESPERTEGLMAAFREAAGGTPARWSMPAPTEHQPSHRIGLYLSPVRNKKNEITAVLMERDPLELAPAGAPAASSDRELRIAVEAGRVLPGVWDADQDSLWVHPLVYEVFQVPESYGGGNLKKFLDLIHPEDRTRVSEDLENSLASGPEFKTEFRVPSADGTASWWAVHGGVQRRASGRPIRIAGLAIDITQRKQAELALRESEERFRAIFERSTAGIALVDISGRFLNANAAFCKMLDCTEQELQQKRAPEIVRPDQSQLTEQYLERAKLGDAPAVQVERQLLRADGEAVWVRASGGPWRRGDRVAGYIAVAQDITVEKRALEVIQESESRFRAMADSSPAYLWITDTEGMATFLNKAASEFLGVDVGSVGDLSTFVHPEDRERIMTAFGQAIAKRTNVVCEYRVRRYDGAYRWVIGQGIPRFSPDGVFLGQAGSAIDVTERLHAEQALRAELESRTRMERELHSLSERLLQAQEQTRQDIARELHDDLGQRVAALGYALFNLKRKLPEISGEAEESIQRLEESIAKLGADIRSLSHRLHPATLDHAGLRVALKALAAEFGAAGLHVTVRLEGADLPLPPDVEVSLFRFAQEALQNVARHAGVAEAEMRLSAARGRLRLRVSDQGVGFDPAARARQGLGLIGMRERARLLQGSFRLRSAPSRGTAIVLEIPLS